MEDRKNVITAKYMQYEISENSIQHSQWNTCKIYRRMGISYLNNVRGGTSIVREACMIQAVSMIQYHDDTVSWQNLFTYFKFFTAIGCGFWNIDIPEDVNNIADNNKLETDIPIEILLQFYADMLNRLTFLVITCIAVSAFFCTFVQAWIIYNMSWVMTHDFQRDIF